MELRHEENSTNMTRFIEITGGIIGIWVLFSLWNLTLENSIGIIILSIIFGPYLYGLIFIAITAMFGHISVIFGNFVKDLNFFKEISEGKERISGHIFIYLVGVLMLLIDWFFSLIIFAN